MDITAANDGRIMVVDWRDSCVHTFSEHSDHLNKFKIQRCYFAPRTAFHQPSEHVIIVSVGLHVKKDLLHVKTYTKTTTFLLKLVAEWRQLSHSPAKMTLAHVHALV